ncbi:hypothetical protein HG536_0D04720 [Torulaspora globosa]|uniref:Uncharacterized protein n=1 Tax=Torulaspora globosa TaxID=48254 RepID=A0A7G3ZHG4_9SACH|nr:uncharacterized protein HG536_0D04720 [Torulaspora globosa]QLL32950.1 hypothetical protein HG536_0D04720 [Torulaspora globosa]
MMLSFGLLVLILSEIALGDKPSCEVVPTAATLDATPHSTTTTTLVTNGLTQIAVLEYYKSVTYVSRCEDSTSSASPVGTTTIPVFR